MQRCVETSRQLDHDGARCSRVRRTDEPHRVEALRVVVARERQPPRVVAAVAVEQRDNIDELARSERRRRVELILRDRPATQLRQLRLYVLHNERH